MPNMAYSEIAFESEPKTCTCQPLIKPRITKNKKVARNEILNILCGMLDDVSSNDNKLSNELQKILISLDKPNPLTNNVSSKLENLVEQHCIVGINENTIKKRLLEIAMNVLENENDGTLFIIGYSLFYK